MVDTVGYTMVSVGEEATGTQNPEGRQLHYFWIQANLVHDEASVEAEADLFLPGRILPPGRWNWNDN